MVQPWNPVHLVASKDRRPDRAVSLDGSRLESQRSFNDTGTGEKLCYTQSVPNLPSSGVPAESPGKKSSSSDIQPRNSDNNEAADVAAWRPSLDRIADTEAMELKNRHNHRDGIQHSKSNGKPARNGIIRRHLRGKTPFTVRNQLQRVLFDSWFNVLLFLAPAGIVLHSVRGDSVETFAVNFVATIPFQFMAEQGLEEIQLRLGPTYSGLLYITTCNLVQLISSILLLVNREKVILQTTLIGGILANILLILGLSFVLGGINRMEQFYNTTTAHVSSNLLSLAATSLLIPTASKLLGQTSDINLAKQSRGASVILILVYILFLVYQLKTHAVLFSEESPRVPARPLIQTSRRISHESVIPAAVMGQGMADQAEQSRLRDTLADPPDLEDEDENEDEDEAEPELYFPVAVFLFISSTVVLFFLVDYVVNSINSLAESAHLSRTFIGLILLPLPNCDFGAIHLAIKDNVDQVIAYTIGKCLQTALCITPFIVLLAWWLGIDEVTLVFDGFEIVSLFAAILLLNFVVSPGKDSWIQGILLLADWALIAIAAYFVDVGPYGVPS